MLEFEFFTRVLILRKQFKQFDPLSPPGLTNAVNIIYLSRMWTNLAMPWR
jgi:hypothetical protein